MIRFIDITNDYFCYDELLHSGDFMPVCAFADTTRLEFLSDVAGSQICLSLEDVEDFGDWKERCLARVPQGFFDTKSDYWKEKLNEPGNAALGT